MHFFNKTFVFIHFFKVNFRTINISVFSNLPLKFMIPLSEEKLTHNPTETCHIFILVGSLASHK